MISSILKMSLISYQINLNNVTISTMNRTGEGSKYNFLSFIFFIINRKVFVYDYSLNLYALCYNELLCPEIPNCFNENCQFSHNYFEMSFHPLRYKIEYCENYVSF